jgi:hypothetical protein
MAERPFTCVEKAPARDKKKQPTIDRNIEQPTHAGLVAREHV